MALAAANYLCTAGGNLRTDAGQRRAVFAYNHSDSYVNQVLALARAYASGIPVADLPLSGNTTGPVPAPDWSGMPAAPGPAIGLRDRTSSPPEQTVGASQSPASQPAGQPAGPPPAPDGTPGTPADPATPDSSTGSQPPSNGAPPPPPPPPAAGQPPPPAPAPIPVPVPVPVPAPVPAPVPPVDPPPPPLLVAGVSCNVPGDLVPDIAGLPVCPP